jgi:hypothetical protein
MATLRLILLLAASGLYLGLVLMTYSVFGPAYPLRMNAERPLVSIERLVIWLGVRTLYLVLRFLRITWDLLRDASAEVGDWFVRRSSENMQAAYRSRFL